MSGRRRLRLGLLPAAVVVVFSVVLAAPPATAMPVLDQSFTAPDDLSGTINDGCKYLAQTFTAGVIGMLTGVNVNVISRRDAPPLRIAIRDATNDRPQGPPLGIRYQTQRRVRLFGRLIGFSERIPVVAGHRYAIQLNYGGAEPTPGVGLGSWAGGTGNHYLGGRMLAADCPAYGDTRFWHVEDISFDLHFRTFVEPAP